MGQDKAMEPIHHELKQTAKVERFMHFESELPLLAAITEWWQGIESDEEKWIAPCLQSISFTTEDDFTSMGAEVNWSHLTSQQFSECVEKINALSSNPKCMAKLAKPETSNN